MKSSLPFRSTAGFSLCYPSSARPVAKSVTGGCSSCCLLVTNSKTTKTGKLEGWEHSSHDGIAEFTREFDQTTKLVIKNDQEPAYVRVATRRYNNRRYNISMGNLRLTGYDFRVGQFMASPLIT